MACEDACFASSIRIIQSFVKETKDCFWREVEEEIDCIYPQYIVKTLCLTLVHGHGEECIGEMIALCCWMLRNSSQG